jgi:hypothetical protein
MYRDGMKMLITSGTSQGLVAERVLEVRSVTVPACSVP